MLTASIIESRPNTDLVAIVDHSRPVTEVLAMLEINTTDKSAKFFESALTTLRYKPTSFEGGYWQVEAV